MECPYRHQISGDDLDSCQRARVPGKKKKVSVLDGPFEDGNRA